MPAVSKASDTKSGDSTFAEQDALTGNGNLVANTNDGASDPERTSDQESKPASLRPGAVANAGGGSFRLSKKASRPQLLSQATTALSLADVHTQSRPDGANTHSSPASRSVSRKPSLTNFSKYGKRDDSEIADDAASLKSYAPTLETRLETESVLDDSAETNGDEMSSIAFKPHDSVGPSEEFSLQADDIFTAQIANELNDLTPMDANASNEDTILDEWKAKLKHFFILSASGKPIYSRHGDDRLTSHYIGVIQTLISFYEESRDPLRSFTAGDACFVLLSKGPLNLVAISRLGESTSQLRTQLESLYMQILSTLTLPSMEKMFSVRPSTDLRRPLQGTEVLLDGLADGFTRGSPSTLLSALECLRLRRTDRRAINNALLAVRAPELLYGLVVASGRLVNVIRPKKHSLHPGDLHLIFNMLFEAGGVRAGEGENWIPLCLPGFNNTGFVYMYVSFQSASSTVSSNDADQSTDDNRDNELAIIFISPSREAFYSLRKMRDDFFANLRKTSTLKSLHDAIIRPRSTCNEIIGPTVLRHFLYKSRGNVQFTMPSFLPSFSTLVARRKLISLYGTLYENIHSKTSHLKVQHVVSTEAAALAWETPLFELYCIAPPTASRSDLAYGANRVVQWVRREEERVFIIGGAVF